MVDTPPLPPPVSTHYHLPPRPVMRRHLRTPFASRILYPPAKYRPLPSVHSSCSEVCSKLIIGDSNLKNVARRRIDSTGNTHVRTIRSATVAQLTNIISTGACYPQVEQGVVAIGTNDCAGNMPCDIAADYQKLW